jgi:hypothetical protein
MNNSCYNYPVNNNYDEETLKRFQNISVNITNAFGNALENENFIKLFRSANSALKLVFDARSSSTDLTSKFIFSFNIDFFFYLNVFDCIKGNMTLLSTLHGREENFKKSLDSTVVLDNQTYNILMKSSPNFNLLYTNKSTKYNEPFDDITLFMPVDIPTELVNFLYGSDLDVRI